MCVFFIVPDMLRNALYVQIERYERERCGFN